MNIDDLLNNIQQVFSTGSVEDKAKLLGLFLNLDLTAFDGVLVQSATPTILDALRLYCYEIDHGDRT